MQKFMYSRAQEEAMRRAAGEHAGGSFMGSFKGLQFLMPWVRARIWELFGYGLDRQPSVERRPQTWKPPAEAGYKGAHIAGDVKDTPPSEPASGDTHAAHASSATEPSPAETKENVFDCRRAHVLTPEEKATINSGLGGTRNVPSTESSTGKDVA